MYSWLMARRKNIDYIRRDEVYCKRHHARQSRNINDNLDFVSHTKRIELIATLPLCDLET